MKPIEIQIRINVLKGELKVWQDILAGKSCRSCIHFSNAPQCALANGAVPPPEVKAAGCPSWEYDEIPF